MKTFDLNHYPLWTAIVTPLTHSGDVDFQSLEKLIAIQEQAQNAIVILGSTGEALNLDSEEKEKIVQFTMKLRPKVPIMVGVPGHHLKSALDWIETCNDYGVDSFLLVTPIYAKPGEDGQRRWFESLLNQAKSPCMLYNVPSRAGVALNLNSAKALAHHPQFWALKEASGSVEKFSEYVECLPLQKIYSGDDALMPDFAKIGAKGLVSVASNLWPEATHRYVDLCLAQNFEGLLPLWEQASEALFTAANPIPAKALLAHLNLIRSPELRLPLSRWDYKHLAQLISYHQKIEDWALKQGLSKSTRSTENLEQLNSPGDLV